MRRRCANDVFSYCGRQGGAKYDVAPLVINTKIGTYLAGGRCAHSPENCKYLRTSSQLSDEILRQSSRNTASSAVS